MVGDAVGTRPARRARRDVGRAPGANETFTVANPDGCCLVQVVYFATTGGDKGTAKLASADGGPPANPDVDVPPGLQEALASDPALGFRSHSEPHIARSPTNPDLLIAGSVPAGRTTTRVFSPRGLRRGPYTVVVLVRRPGEQLQRRLFARLL